MMRRIRTFPRTFMIAAMLAGIGLVAATSASAAPPPASSPEGISSFSTPPHKPRS